MAIMTKSYLAGVAAVAVTSILMLMVRTTDAVESCPQCNNADSILAKCQSALNMSTWPGTMEYSPSEVQAPCACNMNFYRLVSNCVTCQSSDSASYTVPPLETYQLVCTSWHQEWKEIYIPSKSPTSSTVQPTDVPTPPDEGLVTPSHSGLSSGAVAGIVVSAVALIIALAVAGYVYQRRKRDLKRQQEEDDLYKYNSQNRSSYMEVPLPQYTGMIQPTLPPLSNITNLRVMNPDADDDADNRPGYSKDKSFEVQRHSSPGWRRGSFDDD